MHKILFSTIFMLFISIPLTLSAEMTGGDFTIYADVFSTIEDHVSSGGDYGLYGTSGEFGANMPTGGDYTLRAGFQAMDRENISLTLSTDALDLGTIDPAAISSSTLTATASTDYLYGYNVTITEDSDFQIATGHTIDDVADGSVTAGSEEYGIMTSGAAGQYNAADTAITATEKTIAEHASSIASQETNILFRASADQTKTRAGAYSHTVTFTATINL